MSRGLKEMAGLGVCRRGCGWVWGGLAWSGGAVGLQRAEVVLGGGSLLATRATLASWSPSAFGKHASVGNVGIASWRLWSPKSYPSAEPWEPALLSAIMYIPTVLFTSLLCFGCHRLCTSLSICNTNF